MTTYHLNLINDAPNNTETTVRWKCTVCGASCDFTREGLGTPFGTETIYPPDGDTYYGPGYCVPALVLVSKEVFYGYFTDAEIVAINDSPNDAAKATMFRYQQFSVNIPINHPLIINSLHELETLGLLGTGRASEIIAACTPVY
jgi:hypothetical protein